ncbi:MAG: hypothetical protein V5A34_12795 [Halapricum sp.]
MHPILVDGPFGCLTEPREKPITRFAISSEFVEDERAKVIKRHVVEDRRYSITLV